MADRNKHETHDRGDGEIHRVPLKGRLVLPDEDIDPPSIAAFVFDEDREPVCHCELDAEGGELELPDELRGRVLTIALAPKRAGASNPRLDRLQDRGALVVREPFIDPKKGFDLGRFEIPWRFRKGCCRVRGRVVRRIRLPNGDTMERPLCNARVVICEVDAKPSLIVARLPDDLLLRLARDLVDLGEPIPLPDPDPDPPPVVPPYWSVALIEERTAFAEGVARGHRAPLFPTQGHGEGGDEGADHAHGAVTEAKEALDTAPAPVDRLRALQKNPLRDLLLERIDRVKLHWCRLPWLHRRYELDCLRTVTLNASGRFDTHITYDCYGDKPDLYFKVEQGCGDEWRTVHEPSVRCTTRWDYCCGDEVEIVVSTDAGLGPVLDAKAHVYSPGDPASIGSWQSLSYDSQVFVVHAALMWSGKVLLFSGGVENQLPLESRVWDPVTQTFQAHTFADDLFCAFQVALADGRILVMGGSNYNGPHGRGIDVSYSFDPGSPGWTKHSDMAFGRWYPTAVVMPDGKVLTMSGRPASGGPVPQVEIFDPSGNSWSTLPASANKTLEIYPSLHLMHDGKVFYTGTRWAGGTTGPRPWSPPDTAVFDISTNSWTDVGPHVIPNRTEGTSVLLPPRATASHHHGHGEEMPPPGTTSRVLVLGGDCGSVAERTSAEVIDLAAATPAWSRIPDMHHGRVNPNAVILPSGEVLVCAGINGFKWDPDPGRVLEAEMLDSQSLTWRRAAAMSEGRQYHSVSLLLPDGRVLNTGSVGGFGGGVNLLSMEIFSPPYLFRGPRPRIDSYPTTAAHGSTITISTRDACRVRKVVLIRPGAPTHHTDSEQRLVPLEFVREGRCGLRLPLPSSKAVLPPGYYMIFMLDDCGVPSKGKFVRIG